MAETSVFFGTAFPQQTERDKRLGATDAGQFLPAWKQEARDEQGRRRFHGAFTGGFSAGYYNTVGSKEGWTPSQFVSSRTIRGEQKVARVEDFMDEEDLQELASTKRLVTTDEFDTLSGTEKELEKRRQQQLEEDSKRGTDMTYLASSLMNLVAPTHDSTGMRLLRKMGWRPGQGVGPRTTFDGDESNIQQQMTLAPKDTPIVDYQPKTNTFGLGYDLVKHVPQVAEMRRFQQQQQDQQQQQQLRSQSSGFGMGVFDDDDDDTMPYDDESTGFSRKYHHTLYDDNVDMSESSRLSSANKRKHTITGDDLNLKKARCSDGHLPIKGFHLSSQPQELGKWYQPPIVPTSFDEMHTQQSLRGKKTTTGQDKQSSSITIDARGAMLGEKPIEARSVFDYMSSKTKQRLAQATSTASEPPMDKTRLQVAVIPKDVAQLALRGFIPFADTPGKQTRYKHFLESSIAQHDNNNNEPSSTVTFDIPTGMTYESGMKELNEFTQAARIFRPISSMMSGRFTTSTESTTPTSTTSVEQVNFEGGLKTEEQWKKEKEIREKQVMEEPKPKLSQEAEAAAMNMFGPMTRTQLPFYPNRLLCKRFNVRNPHPDHVQQGPGHRTQAGSTSALDEKAMVSMLATPQQLHSPSTTNTPKKLVLAETQQDDPALHAVIPKPSSRTPEEQEKEEKDSKNDDDKPLDYERPTMDIFKAIFDTSEDESDTDDNVEISAQRNNNDNNSSSIYPSRSIMTTESNNQDDDDLIGPHPPPPPSPPSQVSTTDQTTSSPPTFRPMFTKRASQDTTKVYSEQVIVTPFEPRLSSSSKKRTQRRRVSVSSEASSSSDGHHSDTERAKEKKRNRYGNSSKKKKDDNKKKTSHSKKKKRRHHHHSDSDNEPHDRKRHHRHSRKDDNDDQDKKYRSSRKDEVDISLWVEKKPSIPRRSRAEDLW